MGIPNFLPDITTTIGRAVDLRDYKGRRIAIDISVWIQRECHASGQTLADEKHISNYGRATLVEKQLREGHDEEEEKQKQEEVIQAFVHTVTKSIVDDLVQLRDATESKLLAVFDGGTPPVKRQTTNIRKRKRDEDLVERDRPVDVTGGSPAEESRFKANRRAGAGKHFYRVVDTVMTALRQQQIPFLVAPYEADGQLAFLQLRGHVDLVITDDSDLIAYGPPCPLIYKLKRNEQNQWTRGILVRRSDFGARRPGSKPSSLSLLDWSPAMLAALFTAAGGDYCRKLRMIGVKTAAAIVERAFHMKPMLKGENSEETAPLGKVIQSVIASSSDNKSMTDDDKELFGKEFIEAVFMYRHALVFDPLRGECCNLTPLNSPDAELIGYAPYRNLVANTDIHKRIVGDVIPSKIATYIAEGWICPKRMVLRHQGETPDEVKESLRAFKSERQQVDSFYDQTMATETTTG